MGPAEERFEVLDSTFFVLDCMPSLIAGLTIHYGVLESL
jgi:hypothetical protein